jgi:anaerobic ribonucleoside-triphosphate reductase
VLITEFVTEDVNQNDIQNSVLKRDGRVVVFDSGKVFNAMLSAYSSLHDSIDSEYINVCNDAINTILDEYDALYDVLDGRILGVEDIQDIVENTLLDSKYNDVAKAYILYRESRTLSRETTVDKVVSEILEDSNDYWSTENSNKDSKLLTTQRDYMAGAISTDIMRRKILPKHLVEAHDSGILHVHDMDYISMKMYNCCLINLEDMLQNETVISNVKIDKPHKFSTACNIASQVIAQVASSQFGGQSITLGHLSPFVEETRKTFRDKFPNASEELLNDMVRSDIEAGIQTLQYQVLTLMTTNGQAPFLTVFMNLTDVEEGSQREDLAMCIEEMLKQRIQGVKNTDGVYISPAFPKLIYALDECNITKDSQYFYLTELSAKCSAKRLVPDYISTKIIKKLKGGDVFPPMGCRSFLSVDTATENLARAKNWDRHKYHKYYGRMNLGVVTLNLVDVALSSKGDMSKFWELMEERSELVHEAQLIRYNRLKGIRSDVAPILWQHGAIARLDKGEVIDRLLLRDYATISFGYGGLCECCIAMLGKSNKTEEGQQFCKDVLNFINRKCEEWSDVDNLGFSPYGTPMESLTYRFAKTLRKRFGLIKDVTDHDYITNSFHLNVREQVSAFDKISIESQFQELSLGGSIIYTEVPNMQDNIEAVIQLMQYMYEHSMYSEINTKSDYCSCCGFDGEMVIEGEEGSLYWECPNCGNTDQSKMNVCRRVCGYLGTNFFNQGRTEEIKDRVLHLD